MVRKLYQTRFLLFFIAIFPFGWQPFALADEEKKPVIWAFADTHGAYDELVELLKQVKLIDDKQNWQGGTASLISTGDVLDRGPHSRKILDLMIKLEKQASDAGGKFQFLLGNHEIMILVGDLRYAAAEEYAEFANDETQAERQHFFQQFLAYHQHEQENGAVKLIDLAKNDNKILALRNTFNEQFPAGFFARFKAFSPDGYYGRWLLEKPILYNENGNLFTHGGLSPILAGDTLAGLNLKLKKQLNDYLNQWQQLINNNHLPVASHFRQRHEFIRGLPANAVDEFKNRLENLLFSNQSPTWYRGAEYCHPYYEQANLDARLAQFNAKRLFLGHTVTATKQVEKHLNNAYLMDTGMLKSVYQGRANIIKIVGDSVTVYDSKGAQYEALARSHTTIEYPEVLSQAELFDILQNGEIILTEKINTGITEPFRLTFGDPRAKVRALFKMIDTNPGIERRRTRDVNERFADRYHYDIAAYRLSEMLGLHLVPMTVERQIEKIKGMAQYWVEESYSEYTAEENGWDYSGYCDLEQQRNLLNIFDLLIYNKDRNSTNVLIEQDRQQLIWIDHSRAFSIHRKLPRKITAEDIYLTPQFESALQSLDNDNLNEKLGDLLNSDQIKALLIRRNKILSRYSD